MFKAPFTSWPSSAARNGPRILSLVLAALVAAELLRGATTLFGQHQIATFQFAPHSKIGASNAHVEVQQIVRAHLFGIASIDTGLVDPANVARTSANLMLTGTIATQNPKHGLAIISDGGSAKVYWVGADVAGATVHSIYMDRIILDRNGALEALLLPRPESSSNRPPGSASPLDPRTAAALEGETGLLNAALRATPPGENDAEKIKGFRAYPGRNRMAFSKMGLRPGDLITAVNGTPLDDPQHTREMFDGIQSSGHATVSVERNGQTREITVNMAQIIAQTSKSMEIEGSIPAPTPPENAIP